MNGIILYQSKYGATKKYAAWLSEKTGFPIKETKKAKVGELEKYGTMKQKGLLASLFCIYYTTVLEKFNGIV